MRKVKDRLSVYIQGWLWVFGVCKHNKLRDECTPDFSCCTGKKTLMPFASRLLYMIEYPVKSIVYNYRVTKLNKEYRGQ